MNVTRNEAIRNNFTAIQTQFGGPNQNPTNQVEQALLQLAASTVWLLQLLEESQQATPPAAPADTPAPADPDPASQTDAPPAEGAGTGETGERQEGEGDPTQGSPDQ